MTWSLELIAGPRAGARFLLSDSPLVVGRNPLASLPFPEDSFLSNRHCMLESTPTGVLLRDLNSTNGTFLNGQRVTDAQARSGDVIKAGSLTIRIAPGIAASTGPAPVSLPVVPTAPSALTTVIATLPALFNKPDKPSMGSTMPSMESMLPSIESMLAELESEASTVENLPAVVESVPPPVQRKPVEMEGTPASVAGVALPVESSPASVENIMPPVESAKAPLDSASPAVKSMPVEMESALPQVESAPPALAFLESLGEPLYCLLDAARDPAISALIRQTQERHQPLYDGAPEDHLSQWDPYIFSLPDGSDFTRTLLEQGWGHGWASFFTSSASFEELRQHFRKFLMVQIDGGKGVYFRFYDPRVMRDFLPAANENEIATFFGPINSFLLESTNPEILLNMTRTGTGLASDPIRL